MVPLWAGTTLSALPPPSPCSAPTFFRREIPKKTLLFFFRPRPQRTVLYVPGCVIGYLFSPFLFSSQTFASFFLFRTMSTGLMFRTFFFILARAPQGDCRCRFSSDPPPDQPWNLFCLPPFFLLETVPFCFHAQSAAPLYIRRFFEIRSHTRFPVEAFFSWSLPLWESLPEGY